MPTVLRVAGLRFAVYPNDHPPAHVHVIGPGWAVVVNLRGPAVREIIGTCSRRDAARVLDFCAAHVVTLLDAWGRFHG